MLAARMLPLGYSRPALDFSPTLRPVGLLIGCALAFMPSLRVKANVWALLGALLAIAALEEHMVLMAPVAASLVTVALIARPEVGVLAWAPLRYLGKISYGLFLYHVPVLTLGHKWVHGPAGGACLVALAFALAALSYEFVEKPALRLKDRLGSRLGAPVAVPAG
jgi:peptidoglycan/LPS O-acetylase OafA/YrhL